MGEDTPYLDNCHIVKAKHCPFQHYTPHNKIEHYETTG